MEKDATFLIGQKAFIEKDGKLLVLKSPEGVDVPGGKIQESDADIAEALKREVREETQLEIEIGKPFFTWAWQFPTGHKLEGQKIYIVAFKCVYVSGEIILSDEHKEARWLTKENFKDVYENSPWFRAIEQYFA